MLTTLLVTLREGIEAFLIVAITLAYLRKSGRIALSPAVYWGTGVAIALSVIAGYFFGAAENKPLWEGALAAAAAVMVLTMVFYMLKAARHMRSDIAAKVDTAVARPGIGAWVGVFAFVLVMIVREGMETALILTTLLFEQGSRNLVVGATLGVVLAALLAWAWSRYGQRVNLKRFFQVTSIFLVLFTVQLFIYAFHEFTEAGAVPGIDNAYWHIATEPYGPEGSYGEWLTYLMVLVPAAWLALAWWRDRDVAGSPTARAV
ncbi:MAG: FTR1 family protein [Burkholderiales bacterium]|nr:FTR1 family protein [Burkholderiales bacterium]